MVDGLLQEPKSELPLYANVWHMLDLPTTATWGICLTVAMQDNNNRRNPKRTESFQGVAVLHAVVKRATNLLCSCCLWEQL